MVKSSCTRVTRRSASVIRVGVAYVNICVLRHLKEEVNWAIDKRLQLIINIILFKTVICTTKNLRNKTVFTLKQYCMHCYATLSNVFQLIRIKI